MYTENILQYPGGRWQFVSMHVYNGFFRHYNFDALPKMFFILHYFFARVKNNV